MSFLSWLPPVLGAESRPGVRLAHSRAITAPCCPPDPSHRAEPLPLSAPWSPKARGTPRPHSPWTLGGPVGPVLCPQGVGLGALHLLQPGLSWVTPLFNLETSRPPPTVTAPGICPPECH